MIPFVVYWIAWIVAGVVLEAIGLRNHDGDGEEPLTVYVREFMRTSILARTLVLGFVGWVFLHFAIGLP